MVARMCDSDRNHIEGDSGKGGETHSQPDRHPSDEPSTLGSTKKGRVALPVATGQTPCGNAAPSTDGWPVEHAVDPKVALGCRQRDLTVGLVFLCLPECDSHI